MDQVINTPVTIKRGRKPNIKPISTEPIPTEPIPKEPIATEPISTEPLQTKSKKESKQSKVSKEDKITKEPKMTKEPKSLKITKEPKQPKEPKKTKEAKELKGPKGPKQPKEPKEPKAHKAPKAPKEPKQPKAPKEPKQPKESKKPKEPKAPKEPKEPKPPKLSKLSKKDKSNETCQLNDDDDIVMKTKRRGRKPKDKFKYESSDYDEFQKHSKKEDNIIIKLPLSCLKLNEEFNIGKDLFPYNPNLSIPKPHKMEHLITKYNIKYSMINGLSDNDNDISDDQELDNIEEYNSDFNFKNSITEETINNHDFKNIINEHNYSNESKECNDNNYNDLHNTILNANVNTNAILNTNNNTNTNTNYIANNSNNNYNNITTKSTCNNKKYNENTHYCSKCYHCQQNKTGGEEVRQIDIILNNKYNNNTDKINVLTHLGLNLNGGKWIDDTRVACLWCCHSFKNIPWGIPYKFVNEKFLLFGNFCMPNCALAYILQFYKDDDTLWEKVALLNFLYFKVYGNYKALIPAFDKMALTMFGGTIEIDEYRNIMFNNEKTYSVEFPPCNTIIPMLEEIYKKNTLTNTFIPVDNKIINMAFTNELKLKRSKPIINHKNTLDFCLGKTK